MEDLCKRLGVALHVEVASRGEIERFARKEGGTEAAARRFRYAALERARVALSCDFVLTGHTGDDFIETMVMRFCTGSGIAGLRGIPIANGKVYRPLLGVRKSEILTYLEEKKQKYRLDSTNASDDFLRNRVRHDIVPVMFAVFPSLWSSLRTLADKVSFDEDALSALASSLFVSGQAAVDGNPRLDADAFDRAPVAVRARALYRLPGMDCARVPWRMVRESALSKNTNGVLASGAGREFYRDLGRISSRLQDTDQRLLEKPSMVPESRGFGVLVTGPGEYRIGKAAICRVYSSRVSEGISSSAIVWPVWIRSRRPGDRLTTTGGTKLVDSLLSELGLDQTVRDSVPILEDRQGILAVLASFAGLHDVLGKNCLPTEYPSDEMFVFALKGAALTDATRR